MRTDNENIAAVNAKSTRAALVPAPSLRVPVTSSNRAMLRQLRAAELCAWQEADCRLRYSPIPSWFRQPRCTA